MLLVYFFHILGSCVYHLKYFKMSFELVTVDVLHPNTPHHYTFNIKIFENKNNVQLYSY